MKFTPWRPVKLLTKLAVLTAGAMAAVWHWTHEPFQP